ncbi:uncharacterized protein LOC112687365 isoform X5 [Sipha flava]|uniref:Uncharacterized protein LOC112687365 isoform X3 n=2 Tax=Sipha flava TaxID=143950 RepID=A0A8B8FZM2_9HEMI|nr:uncharacterized protein LOC112687365 isoform X3 [Sipha flava]XP_025415802.1 uncharacterized protein LOC112687365 isoform X4 [Sipha flava]XP_025415803.1 uncharacterized protein LOC112687365 isoform X5 [Sipha flava]
MVGQPAMPLYLCGVLAFAAIAIAAATDTTTPQPLDVQKYSDVANQPKDSLVSAVNPPEDSLRQRTRQAVSKQAIGLNPTTKKPHPWRPPRKLVDGPVQRAVAETEAPTTDPQGKPKNVELRIKEEMVGVNPTTKKPHPWRPPRKLVDGLVQRAVAETKAPTTNLQGKPNNEGLRQWRRDPTGWKRTTYQPPPNRPYTTRPYRPNQKLVAGPVRHAVAETEAPTTNPQGKPNNKELGIKEETTGEIPTTKEPHPWGPLIKSSANRRVRREVTTKKLKLNALGRLTQKIGKKFRERIIGTITRKLRQKLQVLKRLPKTMKRYLNKKRQLKNKT